MTAAALARPDESAQVGFQTDATADPRDTFARALLEFSAQYDVAPLALVGAEVMFPDYADGCDAAEVRAAVTAVCGVIAEKLDGAARAFDAARVELTDSAAAAMRDAARVFVAASHLLDAIAASETDTAKTGPSRGAP